MCDHDSTFRSSEACSLLQHVGARRWRDGGICRTAHRWRRSLLTRARSEPLEPVRPPTALVLLAALQPLVSGLHRLLIRPIPLPLAGWIDDASNMTTPTQDKAHLPTGKLRDTPGRFPGHNMILLSANRIDIEVDLLEIKGNALQHNLVRLDEIVLQVGIAQVERMRHASHARAIGVPVEQIKGR